MTHPTWTLLHPNTTHEHLGLIPSLLSLDDPRPAAEQFDAAYVGGWSPFHGFTMEEDGKIIIYSDDPPLQAIAQTTLRHETIRLYRYAWVAIIQPDGSFEISRMD